MSIEEGFKSDSIRIRRQRLRLPLVALLLGTLVVSACASDEAPAADIETSTPEAAVAESTQERPATVADLFPAAPERDLVLNNCATCHAVACAAMGQRNDRRWGDLEAAHREHVPNLADADRERIFAYLRSNFNDSRPEPVIPPEFLDRGCTPF